MSIIVDESPTVVVVAEPAGLLVVPIQTTQVIEVATTASSGGGSGDEWSTSVPVEVANGVRTVFTTPTPYSPARLIVFLNGLKESHFTETSANTFTFSSAPLTGDEISLLYKVA